MHAFKIAYVVLFLLVTLLTAGIRPKIHKPVSFEDQKFSIEEVKKADRDAVREAQKNIQTVVTNVVQPEPQRVVPREKDITDDSANFRPKTVSVTNQKPASSEKTVTVKPQATAVKTQTVTVSQNDTDERELLKKFENIMNESTKNPNKQLSNDEIETVVNVLTSNTTTPPKTTTVEVTPQKTKTLTEQEEIIAWNKWRANLQNRVMKDSKVYAPLGTVFMFSCVVDKYGNISNINAWSTNPDYTAMAKRNVKPALSALQGQSILNFPEGTKRNSTVVAGSFVISYTDRFASPSDYSDYERVKR